MSHRHCEERSNFAMTTTKQSNEKQQNRLLASSPDTTNCRDALNASNAHGHIAMRLYKTTLQIAGSHCRATKPPCKLQEVIVGLQSHCASCRKPL